MTDSRRIVGYDPGHPEGDRSVEHVITSDIADQERRFFDSCRQVSVPRITCPTCNKAFAPARVVTGHPTFSKQHQRFTTARRLYCDHCRQLVRWWEFCDADGRLFGELVNSDGHLDFVRDQKTISVFLEHNPQAICEEAA